MKGTLISSDYIIDKDNNTRLVEINTDTVIYDSFTSSIDLEALHSAINDNSITEFHIVYKQGLHEDLLPLFSSSVAANCPGVTTYGTTEVDKDAIYATSPADASDKFILRFAYDENAILDSVYAKNNSKLYNLFTSASQSGSVPEYYYSSSADGVTNTLTGELNAEEYIPDFVIRDPNYDNSFSMIKANTITSSLEERVNFVVDQFGGNNYTIQKYHINSASVNNHHVTGLREYGIVWGSDLRYSRIVYGGYDAIFGFNTSSLLLNDDLHCTVPGKNFYEYTNKPIKRFLSDGILGEEEIKLNDGTFVAFSDLTTSSIVASHHVNGLPDSDDLDVVDAWSVSGSNIYSGSYASSASVEFITTIQPANTEGTRLSLSGSAEDEYMYIGGKSRLLVYESSSDSTKFVPADSLVVGDHYIQDVVAETLTAVDSVEAVIFEAKPTYYELDVEPDDVFLIKGEGPDTKIVSTLVHNIFAQK